MPKGVKQAILGIWITIALSLIAALTNKWTGVISTGEFAFYIFMYAIFCIFPYKLGKGSNPARWVYTVLTAASMLLMLGGMATEMPKADLIVSVIMIPIEIYIVIQLFKRKASQWFTKVA